MDTTERRERAAADDRRTSRIPPSMSRWYDQDMSGTYAVTMGDRGRLVVPLELREHAGLTAGSPLVLVETDAGVVMLTRDQVKARVRADLAGRDLVADLLDERRRAAAVEDEM